VIRIVLLILASVGSAQARQGCPELVSTATLAQYISKADMAFSTMDENEFRTARWTAQRAVNCLGEPVQAGQAAAYYRMEALGSFLDQNHAQTVAFFRSMLSIAPNYMLPDPMAPAGHPLRIDFEVAQGSMATPGKPIRRAVDGVIRVDGRVASETPIDRPYLFQHQRDDASIALSTVVGVGVEAPGYPVGRGLQTEKTGRRIASDVTRIPRSATARSYNVPLAATAAMTTAVAGISYVVAMRHEARFNDASTPRSELSGLRKKTNSMVVLSASSVAVAMTTGAAAFVVGGTF
jgi:hypothetical protein